VPKPTEDPAKVLVRFEDVAKSFGGVQALRGVTLDVHAGRVLALLGENGAGKSTLIKALAGIYPLDRGRILVEGQPLSALNRSRISFLHQDLALVGPLSVAENIALGLGFPRRGPFIDWRSTQARAEESLALLGVELPVDVAVNTLSRADRSLVALARCLAADPALIVLDEPTASLSAPEVEQLFAVLRRLRSQGIGLLYVSHRLDEVMAISDEAAVLRDGVLVGVVRDLSQTDSSALVEMIVGQRVDSGRSRSPKVPKRTDICLEATQLSGGTCTEISFELCEGEVLGVTGLRGAGHESLGRIVAGIEPLRGGNMRLKGKPYRPRSCAEAIRAGVVYITGDRETEGLAPTMTVRENLLLNPKAHGRRSLALLTRRSEDPEVRHLMAQFAIQPPTPDLTITALSGGNQQKVILARSLPLGRCLTVLSDPTLGVDVGAKAAIYELVRNFAKEGRAMLLVSSDFEEIDLLADRALVMKDGRLVSEVATQARGTADLLAAAAGRAA